MDTNTSLVVLLIVALLGGAWLYLSSASDQTNSQPTNKEFVLKVVEKKLVSGPSTLTARVGDTVTIKIMSDEDEELHVHGYDRSVDITPGTEASLTLLADTSGRFHFELEKSKTELGSLEVLP
jgi:plastocyanin